MKNIILMAFVLLVAAASFLYAEEGAPAYKVTRIVDGDTFEVAPNWEWNGQAGNIVRPRRYNTPEWGEAGYYESKDKLAGLILNKEVELKNPVGLSYERLLCDVYINGQALSDLMRN